MLVLTRKEGEELLIDGKIKIKIFQIKGKQVRVGIEAPREVSVLRSECLSPASVTNSSSSLSLNPKSPLS